MQTLSSKLADIGSSMLGPPMKLANGFPSLGMALCIANQYSLPFSEFPSQMEEEGELRDGTPFKMTCRDEIDSDDAGNGARHYRISCECEGEVIGHVQIRSGDMYLDELEKTVHFDGWYLYDAFVEPSYRGKGVIKRTAHHALAIARRSSDKDSSASVFALISNSASNRALESIGFYKQRTIVYIKIFGKKKWLIRQNRSSQEPTDDKW